MEWSGGHRTRSHTSEQIAALLSLSHTDTLTQSQLETWESAKKEPGAEREWAASKRLSINCLASRRCLAIDEQGTSHKDSLLSDKLAVHSDQPEVHFE